MNDEIAFTKVSLPFGWLGNMSPFPLEREGEIFRTAEHLFQCLRCAPGGEAWEAIKREASPMAAKMVAKRFASARIVVPLSNVDVVNMATVLQLKLQQHPNLARELRGTGDRAIIEDCSKRPHGSGAFWGAVRTPEGWVGENMLGKLWMALRKQA